MAVPTSYTETELKTYMHTVIGSMANHLKFTVASGSYDEALNDALFSYGQTDISLITGQSSIYLLRAYARYAVWVLVVNSTANEIDYTHADSGATYKHSQLYDHAKAQADKARDDIEVLGGDVSGYAVQAYSVQYTDDLYTADATGTTDNEWSRLS